MFGQVPGLLLAQSALPSQVEVDEADASVTLPDVPEDGRYGSVSVNETGKVEAPPSGTDQV